MAPHSEADSPDYPKPHHSQGLSLIAALACPNIR